MTTSVVFLRSNPVAPDSRVEKQASALERAGHKVRIVGWDRSGSLSRHEQLGGIIIERLRLRATFGAGLRNLPHLLWWQVRLGIWLWNRRREYEIIHACDFDTIIPALLAKWFLGKRVIYDIFDFYADMSRRTPQFLRRVIRAVDLWIIGKVDAVILVDESRIEQIAGARPKRVEYIYNTPDRMPSCDRVDRAGYDLYVVYVGILQLERGLMEILQVMRRHPEWSLDLAGFGGDEREIEAVACSLDNARFHGRVPYETTLSLSVQADVLFATYDPVVPNHRYSSANKLFEAMMLGKPIVVARDTSMDKIVEKYEIGFVVNYGDTRQLEEALAEVARWSLKKKRHFAQHSRSVYLEHFSWSKMELRLLRLYADLAPPTASKLL